jgi:hypothetical protein
MEQIINAKLRNQAFWKFLILFLVTIAIIVGAAYFPIHIPFKNNRQLNGKVSNYEQQVFNQKEFMISADQIKTLIDSLGTNDGNDALLERNIADKLTGLSKKIESLPGADTIYASTNQSTVNLFHDYLESKQQLMQSKKAQEQIENLTEQLQNCQTDRDKFRQDAEYYSNTSKN